MTAVASAANDTQPQHLATRGKLEMVNRDSAVEPATKRRKRHKNTGWNSVLIVDFRFTRRVRAAAGTAANYNSILCPLCLFVAIPTAAFGLNAEPQTLTAQRHEFERQLHDRKFLQEQIAWLKTESARPQVAVSPEPAALGKSSGVARVQLQPNGIITLVPSKPIGRP